MKDVAEYNLFDVNPASPLATAHRSRARKTETYETQIKVYKDSARPVVTLMAHLAGLICRFSLSLRSPQLKNRLLCHGGREQGFFARRLRVFRCTVIDPESTRPELSKTFTVHREFLRGISGSRYKVSGGGQPRTEPLPNSLGLVASALEYTAVAGVGAFDLCHSAVS